ncbi:DUF2339 domain-containing protein [Pararhodobacter zhoushanensis]|uniref:DUF2339 domain-containing protein n=1 Tax=Pararhodobacter zhoushanensis TaxID=2479545 RepID=A0ABT3H0F9_9RHOB|nr:DUF2339 domain-containing protein [Pararhodobacter zhoushanensis]MCW1933256.1 DUF2339 domain-containing protein [Pararhodobacter zhoushanensis]
MFETLTFVIALFAAGLVWLALQRLRRLSDRVAQLEAHLGQGGEQPTAPPASKAPWRPVPAAKAPTPTVETVPKRDFAAPLNSFAAWMRANWIYPVAGLALVMAGIYLVQYSIDKGLLSPKARIGLTLASGAALILAAEGLRRRWGARAHQVPATLAGGGIAALLAGVLAAHHLYDLLSPEATLIALCLISALSMALGWMHGPILAAMGVLAGAAAPFLLGEGARRARSFMAISRSSPPWGWPSTGCGAGGGSRHWPWLRRWPEACLFMRQTPLRTGWRCSRSLWCFWHWRFPAAR